MFLIITRTSYTHQTESKLKRIAILFSGLRPTRTSADNSKLPFDFPTETRIEQPSKARFLSFVLTKAKVCNILLVRKNKTRRELSGAKGVNNEKNVFDNNACVMRIARVRRVR